MGSLNQPIRTILIDDHTLVRQSLHALLDQEGVCVVGEASTLSAGFEVLKTVPHDVVLLDIALPDSNGLDTILKFRKVCPEVPVLVLSMHVDETLVLGALQAGANGYIDKGASREELLAGLRSVSQGGSYLQPGLAQTVVRAVQSTSGRGEALTPRQLQILTLCAAGLSNQAIADQLFLSLSTVKTSLANVYRKLGVTDRTQAVLEGIRRGVIERPNLRQEL